MAASKIASEYKANDWLELKSLLLAPDDLRDIVNQKMFRAAFLNLKIGVMAETKGPELKKDKLSHFERRITLTALKWRKLVRDEARKAFTEVATAWRNWNKDQTEGKEEKKKAFEAVKRLESKLKGVLRELPRDLRESAAETIDGLSADDFFTVSQCDYDVRLAPTLFGLEGSDGGDEGEIDKDLLKVLTNNKDEWLECIVLWQSQEKGRICVAKKGKSVAQSYKNAMKKELGNDPKPREFEGRIHFDGKELEFAFEGKAPGGGAAKQSLQAIVEEQIDKKYKIVVSAGQDFSEEEDEDDKSPPKKK